MGANGTGGCVHFFVAWCDVTDMIHASIHPSGCLNNHKIIAKMLSRRPRQGLFSCAAATEAPLHSTTTSSSSSTSSHGPIAQFSAPKGKHLIARATRNLCAAKVQTHLAARLFFLFLLSGNRGSTTPPAYQRNTSVQSARSRINFIHVAWQVLFFGEVRWEKHISQRYQSLCMAMGSNKFCI